MRGGKDFSPLIDGPSRISETSLAGLTLARPLAQYFRLRLDYPVAQQDTGPNPPGSV